MVCQFPCLRQRGFPRVTSLALPTSLPMAGTLSTLQCRGGAKSSSVETSPTKCQNGSYPDSAKQPFTCRELQPMDHLRVGELALTFKTPCENYTVCKKRVACGFTSESRVPPIHQSTIRNKRFMEEFNSVANNSNKTDIPEVAGITCQLRNKIFAINKPKKDMDISRETRLCSCGS